MEGAERRVRTFFRAGPEQLEASGFEKVDSVGTGSVEGKSMEGKSMEAKSTETKSVGNRTRAPRTATVTKAAGGSSCWRERVCVKGPNGESYGCTEWRETGSCSGGSSAGGIGTGGLPGGGAGYSTGNESGGAQPQKKTLGISDVDGGPIPISSDPLPTYPCDSANPPDYCEIGCKLSASELMPEESSLALGSADEADVETLVNLVMKFGGQFGLDSKAETKHSLGQVAHENANRVLGAEMDVPVEPEDLLRRPEVTRQEEIRDGDGIFNFQRVKNSKRLRFCIHYAEADRLGNGGASTCDGWKYRGRGPMQLTGEYNYEQFNQEYQTFAKEHGWSHPDIVESPELVSNNARIGAMAALEYWDRRVDGKLDDNPTVEEITEAINGGDYGLADRKEQYDAIKENVSCVE